MNGMSPPPTAGSLHSVGTPTGAPMMPPGMFGSAPPTAASVPPMGMPGSMPFPQQAGMPMSPPMMGGPMPTGPGAMVPGFGYSPYGMPEIRHSPHRNRPENKELPPHRKVVKEHQHHVPGHESIPHGSSKFDLYGALEDIDKAEFENQMTALARRRRINCIPALNSLFVPWVLFLVVYSLASFYFHYYVPAITFFGNFFILVCVVLYAYSSFESRKVVGPQRAFYPTYMAIMCLVSVAAGWLLGDLNFWFNMHAAYNIEHLGTYNNVNPSTSKDLSGQDVPALGKRYQDAGKVYFQSSAVLDFNKSMSFKMGELYCVTPIVDPSCKKNCGYDFWAVGLNCCAEDVADFRCGEYSNPAAKAGLRLMHDEQRPNFRLAVVQAEGVHKIVSNHPIFFYWIHDPVKEIEHIKRKGFKDFVILMILSFFGFAAAAYLTLKKARESFGAPEAF